MEECLRVGKIKNSICEYEEIDSLCKYVVLTINGREIKTAQELGIVGEIKKITLLKNREKL